MRRNIHLAVSWSLIISTLVLAQIDEDLPQWLDCPQLLPKILVGYAPRENLTAGIYKKSNAEDMESCVAQCCSVPSCNIVFMHKLQCYQVECKSDVSCEPVFRPQLEIEGNIRMVLVKPVTTNARWEDIFDLSSLKINTEKNWYNNLDPMEMAESTLGFLEKSCISDVCPVHEHCIKLEGNDRTSGVCVCINGYARDSSGSCVLSTIPGNMTAVSALLQSQSVESTQAPFHITKVAGLDVSEPPVKPLTVSAVSKIVRLPENEVTLSAYTVPAEQPGEKYNYEWKLLSQPDGSSSGTMTDLNGGTLKLSNLSEGLYTFKVAVSGPGVYGEAVANVTVMPPKRINKPPIAVIKPSKITVKLPNTVAVLDGSASSDDDEIVSWHWELNKGPIGYQPHLEDTALLQLRNLNTPGNYTFMLTVEDSDHAKNSTTANITVLKVPDYPPVANAGEDVLVYLPKNNVTLNGSLSTDDKGIVSWEWTKSLTDQDKAVDMQNTRTPFLQLSNLEEGMYTFVLKVTDNSDQSDSASVHVFVKPPTNNPPTAVVGPNLTISLPQTTVLLNGSKSSDDIKIVSWKWEQLSGPNRVTFTAGNESVTNATGLTKGVYTFQLTVEDANGNSNSASLTLTVNQNSNTPPKANAGGDQTVTLPVDVLVLNGSQSHDDLGIAKWQWTREPTSLALGTTIAGTDTSPVLMLINVVAGRYVFRLKVMDDQGEWDEDTVSVIVKPDPHLYHLVELTLNIESNKLSKSQIDSVVMKLGLLLRDAASLVVRLLRTEETTGRAVLVFYVQTSSVAMSGPTVVRTLKNKLAQDSLLLQLSVANIQTAICQNNCSGHGVCDQATRSCMCEAFWMEDIIRKHFGDGDSNCDWSILYVVIALFTGVVLIVGCVWSLLCLCARACCHKPAKRQRYALLDNNDDIRLPLGKVVLSESESDSDVLFESRKSGKSANGVLRNGLKLPRNGFKTERLIKT